MAGEFMDPGQVGTGILNAFQMGMQQRQQNELRSAFGDYVQNPTDANAVRVTRLDPGLGMQLRQQQQAKAQQQQAQQVRMAAAQGDPKAIAQLAGIDFDAWMKLDDHQHQAIAERTKYIGQAALRISQLPEDQRPAAWDQAVTAGSQYFPDLMQFKGQYSPQALQSAIDHAGLVSDLISTTKPQYMAVPQGADLVNVRDPAAVGQFGAEQGSIPTVSDQHSYDAIPAGGKYLDPQGNVRTKPGGSGGNAAGSFPHLNNYYGH